MGDWDEQENSCMSRTGNTKRMGNIGMYSPEKINKKPIKSIKIKYEERLMNGEVSLAQLSKDCQ